MMVTTLPFSISKIENECNETKKKKEERIVVYITHIFVRLFSLYTFIK